MLEAKKQKFCKVGDKVVVIMEADEDTQDDDVLKIK